MNAEAATLSARERIASIPGQALLGLVLKLDAVTTGANGIAYIALADVIDSGLGVSAGAVRGIGIALVAYSAAVWILASRSPINRTGVRVVIAANAIWAVDSASVLIAGWVDPQTGRRLDRASGVDRRRIRGASGAGAAASRLRPRCGLCAVDHTNEVVAPV